MHFSTVATGAALVGNSLAAYTLKDNYMDGDFFSKFNFDTFDDPTKGVSQYVDQSTAGNNGLISLENNQATMRVDAVTPGGDKRRSIRVTSKASYQHALIVADVQHMPSGCGTWPAFWTVGGDWPNQGEIDIIEGFNKEEFNAATLHTSQGCTIKDGLGNGNGFNGKVKTWDCWNKNPDQFENAGCGIQDPNKSSYGEAFNSNGGGVYAMKWTDSDISVWFWPRGTNPGDALGDSPNPGGWGTASAQFTAETCPISEKFKDHRIVINIALCGDLAGGAWGGSACQTPQAPTCADYVLGNPSAMSEAYWTFNALKVYQDAGAPAAKASGIGAAENFPRGFEWPQPEEQNADRLARQAREDRKSNAKTATDA
ncbi:glycoside hydrolase family 16 protein [Aaosphaeria arxii CBS 175.79]|uniref:endo-1,3(4)-beta-glucanase n=1 Tax=Aaosphaeria arxii CBS 175.79 TaxID=1450172 RepID=A0A6A5XK25_9PLEO|nr:glycoside hydrolase family 16 protein [Aaosphaeria arxii CBS 175.79]KAF2013482.1 glycoside hydrolase family 16 protein [Aaosphaeria arxii CBS 175.79]